MRLQNICRQNRKVHRCLHYNNDLKNLKFYIFVINLEKYEFFEINCLHRKIWENQTYSEMEKNNIRKNIDDLMF